MRSQRDKDMCKNASYYFHIEIYSPYLVLFLSLIPPPHFVSFVQMLKPIGDCSNLRHQTDHPWLTQNASSSSPLHTHNIGQDNLILDHPHQWSQIHYRG